MKKTMAGGITSGADRNLKDAIRQHINLPDAEFKEFMRGFIEWPIHNVKFMIWIKNNEEKRMEVLQ